MGAEAGPVVEAGAVLAKEVVAGPPEEASKESEPIPAASQVRETSAPAGKVVGVSGETVLYKFLKELPSIIDDAEYNKMWGVTLSDESHVPTTIVLEKFLRANLGDISKAKAQLIEALKWRKTMQPEVLLADTEYDGAKFGGLGYVTPFQRADDKGKEIITWNIYGGVKDTQATFGNVQEFIKWRCALMELSLRELDLASASTPIPENGPDPYRMIQVHDYLNVSFLRMDPTIRAASKETIQTFSMAYPELLKEKFFVNVPLVMGWVFTAMKVFMSPETIKKFHPLSYGSSLAREIKDVGDQLPEQYGGKGEDIKTRGLTVKYATEKEAEDKSAS